MGKARKTPETKERLPDAPIRDEQITDTLRNNYMPYSMSVIVSRAIPEIDGFKPAHRKLLYTMYQMGLLDGPRTKSANVVGATMKLNPHGDAAIYETMVRLTRGNGALLHPFVDSKGSFGRKYSKMAYAAARYTEVKLDPICNEIFSGIKSDAVDMVDNYDGELKEPVLLPTRFPNILVSPNSGIAVGLASSICSFNLREVCDTAIALIRDPNADLFETLKAPDFSTGGELVYDKEALEQIYQTGRGTVKLRSKWRYLKEESCIEVYEIPYSTDVETILDQIVKLVKDGKYKEISDVRDETDLSGLKLVIDLKYKSADPERLMARLMHDTSLACGFSCNFNVLVGGTPRLLGVREILDEWHAFRRECLKRELNFELRQKRDRLHLLLGLAKILVDIDRAIRIIRSTDEEARVIPNLMEGFEIDRTQAEYIAEIKLRHLNREYILNRVSETESLKQAIAEIEATLDSKRRQDTLIVKELNEISKTYGIDRKTEILYDAPDTADLSAEPEKEEFFFVVMTREGYFKKITRLSIRGNDEQKLKEGDEIVFSGEVSSFAELLFFTDRAQVYKARLGDFESTKASALGDYVPAKLGFDEGEKVLWFLPVSEFTGQIVIGFANGKCVRFNLEAYQTKSNRKKLSPAFSAASPAVGFVRLAAGENKDLFLISALGKCALIKSGLVSEKATRTSSGITCLSLKRGDSLKTLVAVDPEDHRYSKCRKIKLPTAGVIFNPIDVEEEQTKLEL